jgi:hypothetical protein
MFSCFTHLSSPISLISLVDFLGAVRKDILAGSDRWEHFLSSKDSSDLFSEVEIETDDLLKQKGVTVNKEGILMIPSQKLSLSEDLCKVGCSEKGKKQFVCQICDKVFMRKDKVNYHIYSDHHEDFVRLGKGIPQILTKVDLLNNSDPDIQESFAEEETNVVLSSSAKL